MHASHECRRRPHMVAPYAHNDTLLDIFLKYISEGILGLLHRTLAGGGGAALLNI